MIAEALRTVLASPRTDPGLVARALEELLDGDPDPIQSAAFLAALAARPVDSGVLAAGALALLERAVDLPTGPAPLLDTCGTGGDGSNSFNVSTAAALVVAACGVPVAKHGNRAVSSRVGSADVLEAAGCRIDLSPGATARVLERTGFAFLFAPLFHPTLARVAALRRCLGVRTLFNLLGPLCHPARAELRLLGVYDPALVPPMAEALERLGVRRALVVHCDGLDELGLHGTTRALRVEGGRRAELCLDPEDLGLARAPRAALAGGDAAQNARLLEATLRGDPGPRTDAVLLNAAAALEVAGAVGDLREGIERGRRVVREGGPLALLEAQRRATHEEGETS